MPRFVVPNLRDLKIEIRETHGLTQPITTVWYFKGPRQRIEHFFGSNAKTPITTNIFQCDQKTEIMLREYLKTYRSTPITYTDDPLHGSILRSTEPLLLSALMSL